MVHSLERAEDNLTQSLIVTIPPLVIVLTALDVHPYSDPVAPACSTTLAHRVISERTNVLSSSGGGVTIAMWPRPLMSRLTTGSATIVLSSALSLPTIANGVFAGATIICQADAS